ncbi:MAG: M23 family metallopeptidase [Firmicutes bacterium]|nr:M23 family metallopeptidase [Bacillota bacterium]
MQRRTLNHTGRSKRGLFIALGLSAIGIAAITLIIFLQGPNPIMEDEGPPVAGAPIVFTMPVAGATLGQGFTQGTLAWNQTLGHWRSHRAQNFIAPEGSAVLAVYAGQVESVTSTPMTGTTIVIRHSQHLQTVYRSLATEVNVTVGQRVTTGQRIGSVGIHPSWRQDGPQLMLEVLYRGNLVNPMLYFDEDDK